MELHFCSQCGISIPLAEVQSGEAGAGEGRYVCSEHRASGSKPGPALSLAPADVELLFCANCKTSVPAGDVESGRAKREFGSLLCAPCSAGDVAEKDRRRKAVEDEMAGAPSTAPDTAEGRRCAVCQTSVPQSQIASGRALADGSRVVCPRCRDAGATLAVPASSASAGAGTWVLVGLLVVACAATGFFGAEYLKTRRSPAATAPVATSASLDRFRAEVEGRLTLVEQSVAENGDGARASQQEALDVLQSRLSDDLLALREDLSDVRGRLTNADGDMVQRIAKLEGQVLGLQEMVKGLASRPSGGGDMGPRPGPEASKPPEGPPPDVAPGPQPDGVDPEVTRLVKDMLESADVGKRFAAATELIRRKERSAVPAFAQVLVSDGNMLVRRAGASGLGEIRAWYGVPALIQALEDKEPYVAQRANFAIQAITGQDFGVTVEHSTRDRKTRATAATKWWDKNKDTPPDGVCLEPVPTGSDK